MKMGLETRQDTDRIDFGIADQGFGGGIGLATELYRSLCRSGRGAVPQTNELRVLALLDAFRVQGRDISGTQESHSHGFHQSAPHKASLIPPYGRQFNPSPSRSRCLEHQ